MNFEKIALVIILLSNGLANALHAEEQVGFDSEYKVYTGFSNNDELKDLLISRTHIETPLSKDEKQDKTQENALIQDFILENDGDGSFHILESDITDFSDWTEVDSPSRIRDFNLDGRRDLILRISTIIDGADDHIIYAPFPDQSSKIPTALTPMNEQFNSFFNDVIRLLTNKNLPDSSAVAPSSPGFELENEATKKPKTQTETQAQTQTLSGTISLPASITSNEDDIKFYIYIEEYNSDSSRSFPGLTRVSNESQSVVIPAGSTSTDYKIDFAQPAKNSQLRLLLSCVFKCETLGNRRIKLLLQNDGSISRRENLVPANQFPFEQNVQLPEPPPSKTLRGKISLPKSIKSNENDLEFVINIEELRKNGGHVFVQQDIVTMRAGKASVRYKMDYFQPRESHNLKLSFYCKSGCTHVNPLNKVFVLQDNGSFKDAAYNQDSALIPVKKFPKKKNFKHPEPPKKQTLSGTVSLPDSITSNTKDRRVSIIMHVSGKGGAPVYYRTGTHEDIPLGSTETSYELEYYLPEGSTEILLGFRCGGGCAGFITWNYLQKDGTFTQDPSFDRVPIDEFPLEFDLQIP